MHVRKSIMYVSRQKSDRKIKLFTHHNGITQYYILMCGIYIMHIINIQYYIIIMLIILSIGKSVALNLYCIRPTSRHYLDCYNTLLYNVKLTKAKTKSRYIYYYYYYYSKRPARAAFAAQRLVSSFPRIVIICIIVQCDTRETWST